MLRRRVRQALVGALEHSTVLPRLRRRVDTTRAVILAYHSVSESTPANELYRSPEIAVAPRTFERQMEFLRRWYQVVPLDAIVDCLIEERPFPPRAVAITFDDGYRDNITSALPVLQRFGLSATVFVTTGAVGNGWAFWVARLRAILLSTPRPRLDLDDLGSVDLGTDGARRSAVNRLTRTFKAMGMAERETRLDRVFAMSDIGAPVAGSRQWFLGWDEIRALSEAGIGIGAHTSKHPILPLLDDVAVEGEVSTSKAVLEEKIGKPVRHFAYPNGGGVVNVDDRVSDLVRRAGFRSGSASTRGPVRTGADRFQLRRIGVSERHRLDGFALDLERDRLLRPDRGAH
jgi:peptidoglycan/xylan/chitin deacetylase (PgdA/CDA1 family)